MPLYTLKFATKTDLNMPNSMVMFTLCVFDRKDIFWANLVLKFKIVCMKWNFVISNSNMYAEFNCGIHFICLRLEIPFFTHLFHKMKTVCLSWNLVLRLILIWKIQWWFSFFSFVDRKYLFGGNVFQKLKFVCWSWNLQARLIQFQICWVWWWFSFFFFFRSEIPFLG